MFFLIFNDFCQIIVVYVNVYDSFDDVAIRIFPS